MPGPAVVSRRLRALGAGALAAPLLAVGWVTGAAAAYAAGDECVGLTTQADPGDVTPADGQSRPISEMEVDRAQARLAALGVTAGHGVVVAVLDSGIPEAARAAVNVVGHVDAGNKAPAEDYHGTAVAGLIAGQPTADDRAIGVAPGAQLLDVQVYDDQASPPDSADSSPVTVPNVVAGLDAVLAALPQLDIKIVNISLALPDDPAIEDRIEQLWQRGVVTVAPTGNRPGSDETTGPLGAYAVGHRPGEDAAADAHPADYDHVVAVSSSMTGMGEGTDPTDYVLENSMTKVSAATAGGVSYSVFGTPCNLTDPATSWAAAEVSGVLALLQSAYDEPIAASVTRLYATASGRTDVPNTLDGAGEVQVMEALTRPLVLDEDGTNAGEGTIPDQPQRLSAPKEPPDLLASTRQDAVWWGLLGGGLLLLALVLRPMLARRRTQG